MSHLPVEVLSHVIRDLPPHHGQKLAPLATINRHWQSAVEAVLWRHIGVIAYIDLFILLYQTRTRRQAEESTSDDEDVTGYRKPGQDKNTIKHQRVEPDIFLVEGVDDLSTAVHYLLSYCGAHLTELFLNVNHISPSLFWPSNANTTSSVPLWPNLSTVDIRTGFETAVGAYWMRSDSDYPANTHHLKYYFDYEPDSSNSSNTALTRSPVMYFRIRPEPTLFDVLAISIACAISHMPKLAYLNIDSNTHHLWPETEPCENFKNYESWACYFRAGNNARFASTCFRSERPDPGPDWNYIERPRLELVFQCPFPEVQWKQLDEADTLCRKKFPDVDFGLVTLAYQGYKRYDTWERRRDGKVIDRSRRKKKKQAVSLPSHLMTR